MYSAVLRFAVETLNPDCGVEAQRAKPQTLNPPTFLFQHPDVVDIIYRISNRSDGLKDPGIRHGQPDVLGQH